MTWRELKLKLDCLTEEQLDSVVIICEEERPMKEQITFHCDDEPWYYDVECHDEGCFKKSDISEREFIEMDTKVALPSNTPYLFIEPF